jgi:hypothetical protein
MTREEIQNMPAGRDMDDLIRPLVPLINWLYGSCSDPRYAAELLIEADRHGWKYLHHNVAVQPERFFVKIQKERDNSIEYIWEVNATANTFSLACCRAFLMAWETDK